MELFLVATLWMIANKEFVVTASKQVDDGYKWHKVECRKPDENIPHFKIKSPNGREYICLKLKKITLK